MGIREDCSHLFDEKMAWTEGVRSAFLKHFQTDEVRRLLGGAKGKMEATAVVFGKTASGKTTLILKLLGVSESPADGASALIRLGRALRGNKDRHKTGTASSIIYRRGDSDGFVLSENGRPGRELDEPGIKAHVEALRARVEAGQPPSDTVTISIPHRYFDPKVNADGVTVIDIPGTGAPGGSNEDEHLGRLIRGIVHAASLILVVGRADDVTDVMKTTIPELGKWSDFRGRVRFVFTYFFTSRSVQSEAGLEMTTAGLRQYMSGQIDETNPPAMAHLYPVEYSDSWEEFHRTNPLHWGRLNPVVQQVFADLRTDIQANATLTALNIAFLSQETTVKRLLDEGRGRFVASIKKLKEEEEGDKQRAEQAASMAQAIESTAKKRRQELEDFDAGTRRMPSFAEQNAMPVDPTYKGDAYASKLDEWVASYQDAVMSKIREWLYAQAEDEHLNLQTRAITAAQEAARMEPPCFQSRYWADQYWQTIFANFARDSLEAGRICFAIYQRGVHAADACLRNAVEERRRALQAAHEEAGQDLWVAERDVHHADALLEATTQRRMREETRFEGWSRKCKQDVETAGLFGRLLRDGWEQEHERIFAEVNDPARNPAEKTLLLALAFGVDREVDRLLRVKQ